ASLSSLHSLFFIRLSLPPPTSTLFPYTTLFRSSPNINVAINADTRVGKVRIKLSRNLKKLTTTLFLVMLEDDKTATGSANKAPMRDPRKLIFKVSINGFQILGI